MSPRPLLTRAPLVHASVNAAVLVVSLTLLRSGAGWLPLVSAACGLVGLAMVLVRPLVARRWWR